MKKISLFFATIFSTLFSDPISFEVELGSVKTQRMDNNFIIESFSQNTYLKWDAFNILENEKVTFIQPNSNSCVLNRVLNEPSKIFGTLKSNANVFLLNQNGIIFGKNAKIDVASFIASTLDIKDPSSYFENKQMLFEDGCGAITNLGKIEAFGSDIYLISKNIDNQGELIAKNGSINLASANRLIIKPSDENKILILSDVVNSDCQIINSGKIESIDTNIISHGNPYTAAIKHSGMINATDVESKNSKIYLFAKDSKLMLDENATINAKNGAEIYLLGKEVHLNQSSSIEANSENDPCKIFIGGSFQGKDTNLPSSDLTFVGKNVKINANGIGSSDGGKVIVWSNGITAFYGDISVRGGDICGNGGFVEISGKDSLIFDGLVNAKAIHGKVGTLLLDPSDITISTAANSGGSFSGGNPNIYTPGVSPNVINNVTLGTNWGSANVIINTASADVETGNITFVGGTTITATAGSSNTLTLNADQTGASILTSGVGTVTLTGGTGGVGSSLVFNADLDINFTNAFTSTNLNSVTFNAGNDITNSAGAVTLTFFATAPVGNLTLNADQDINISGGNFTINNAKNVFMNADRDFKIFSTTAARTLDINSTNNIEITTGRDFIIDNSSTFTGLLDFSTSSNISVQAERDIKILGRLENTSTLCNITLTSTNDILIGPSASTSGTLAQRISRVSALSGNIMINSGHDLKLVSGTTLGGMATQIGYDSASGVNTNIYLTVENDVLLQAAAATGIGDSYALIGHGSSPSTTGNKAGNIIINRIGRNLTLQGGGLSASAATTENFAQIGHAHVDAGGTLILSGDIRGSGINDYAQIGGNIKLIAGAQTQCYAQIAHGGSNTTVTALSMSGNIFIQATDIELEAGSASDTAAAIGFRSRMSGGTGITTISNSSVKVRATNNLLLKGGDSTGTSGIALIGGFVNTTSPTRTCAINMELIDITVGGYATLLGGLTSANENFVFLGAEGFDTSSGSMAGTSMCNLNINVANDLSAVARNGEKIHIMNGDTPTTGKTFNFKIGKDLFVQAEAKGVELHAIDTANYNIGRDLQIYSDEEEVFISAQNNLTINVKRDILLVGHCESAGTFRNATIKTEGGNLFVFTGRNLTLGPFGRILNNGPGEVLIVVDNDYPNPWKLGPGAINFNVHSQVGRSGGGSVRIFTASRSQNFIANYIGSTFVDSTLNNTRFIPGAEFVNTPIEQWATYYPSSFGGSPFTIFYKDFLIPSVVSLLAQDPGLLFSNYELFYKPFYRYFPNILFYNPWPQVNEATSSYIKKELF